MTGTGDDPRAHPGLVIAWEKRDDIWFALVSYYLEPDGVLVQQWLPSTVVTPAQP